MYVYTNSYTVKPYQMKIKKSKFVVLLLGCITMGLSSFAQEVRISNVQKENIFEIVVAQLDASKTAVGNLDKEKQELTTDYCEYAAGLFTNRAKVVFRYENNELIVSLTNKETKSTSGWGASFLPSKKADEKLIQSFVSRINTAKSNFISTPNTPATTGISISNLIGATSIEQLKAKNAKNVMADKEQEYEFSEGLCAIHRDNFWGFIDTLGNVTIDFKYGSHGQPRFHGGICNTTLNTGDILNTFVCIDKKGNVLFADKKYTYVSPFSEGMAIAERKIGAPYLSLINTKGVPIPGAISPNLVAISWSPDFLTFSEGLSPMFDRKIDGTGYINTKGQWAISPSNKYSEFSPFHEGLAFVKDKITSKWGAINVKGEVIIPFQFTNQPGSFSEGLAAVVNREHLMGYMDKSGKIVIDCQFDGNQFENPFVNGYTLVVKETQTYSLSNTGAMVPIDAKIGYSQIQPGGIVVFQGKEAGSRGIMNINGKVIINPNNYTFIGKFKNGLAYAESSIGDEMINGFINMEGKYEIVFTKQIL